MSLTCGSRGCQLLRRLQFQRALSDSQNVPPWLTLEGDAVMGFWLWLAWGFPH